MTEDTEGLVLEILKRMQADLVRIREDLVGLRAEVTAIRHDLAGLRTMQDLHHSDIGSIKVRLDRIEKRLELAD